MSTPNDLTKSAITSGQWLDSNRTSKTHNHPDRFWERDVHTARELRLVATAKGATVEEAEANARLIALAPQLLEACRAFLHRYDCKATRKSLELCEGEMRHVVAKAEGR